MQLGLLCTTVEDAAGKWSRVNVAAAAQLHRFF